MKKHAPNSAFALPMMMTELATASWETIWHRSMQMVSGTCTVAEYQRMVTEKMAAAQAATAVMLTGGSQTAALAPYVTRARANARRLRRTG